MQFEPLTSDSCKPGTPNDAPMSAVRRLGAARRDQRGYVAILVACLRGALLMPLCAISVDVARWYVEVQRVQNAADAAATAGVTYLPDDFASAKATAIAVATRNGYPNSGNTSVAVVDRRQADPARGHDQQHDPERLRFVVRRRLDRPSRAAPPPTSTGRPDGQPVQRLRQRAAGPGRRDRRPRGPTTSVIVAPPGGARAPATRSSGVPSPARTPPRATATST